MNTRGGKEREEEGISGKFLFNLNDPFTELTSSTHSLQVLKYVHLWKNYSNWKEAKHFGYDLNWPILFVKYRSGPDYL